ncbi:hypothetical protein K3495_g4218 [Podosphaera aphanis]|nr:hypothetical protein K3495_g4218 [Podosphaera aphanis]
MPLKRRPSRIDARSSPISPELLRTTSHPWKLTLGFFDAFAPSGPVSEMCRKEMDIALVPIQLDGKVTFAYLLCFDRKLYFIDIQSRRLLS